MADLKNYLDIDDIEVGIDEAGLGCVAGSFFVGVALSESEIAVRFSLISDSISPRVALMPSD